MYDNVGNMGNVEKLKRSLDILKSNVSGFPIGAVTPDDYKPIEEKIQDLRVSLKCLSSRLQMLQIKMSLDTATSSQTLYDPDGVDQLNVKLTNCLIDDHASKISTCSKAAQDLFFANDIDPETQSRMKAIMKKLFIMNDKVLNWQSAIVELKNKEIERKDECGQYITEFSDFLKEQEGIRNSKLQELNPEVAAKRERVRKLVYKINLMKRLITNFISNASPNIQANPEFQVMLKKHRDLVSIDSIKETADNHDDDRED